MRVENLMTAPVQSCRPEDSLERAAQLMWECDCGSIPVCTTDGVTRAVGMITDRDICMCAYSQGKPLRELKVADAIADQELRVCKTSDSVSDAENAMREARVRRLPVVDTQGALVGVLSLADLAREAHRQQSGPGRQITEAEVNETLFAICQSRASSLQA
jgi:CBS-domain-containing membrane protein